MSAPESSDRPAPGGPHAPSLALRDLFRLPTLVSLTRAPLAIAFLWWHRSPALALSILALAGLSDVLDGWIARRTGAVTDTGALVDGVVDKLFVLAVAGSMLSSGELSWGTVALLGVRDAGEVLLLAVALLRFRRTLAREHPHASPISKATTMLQFATVVAAILSLPTLPLAALTALSGAIAVVLYAGELRDHARGDHRPA